MIDLLSLDGQIPKYSACWMAMVPDVTTKSEKEIADIGILMLETLGRLGSIWNLIYIITLFSLHRYCLACWKFLALFISLCCIFLHPGLRNNFSSVMVMKYIPYHIQWLHFDKIQLHCVCKIISWSSTPIFYFLFPNSLFVFYARIQMFFWVWEQFCFFLLWSN